MVNPNLSRLRTELEQLGSQPVRLPAWDRFILGETDELTHEVMSAREAASRELERWRSGRFPSVVLAVADAVFSKQKDYAVAVRTATRPFAQQFAEMPLAEFCDFDRGNVFRLTFGKEPRPDKERAHLAPEGRIRTIQEACRVLCDAGVETPVVSHTVWGSCPNLNGAPKPVSKQWMRALASAVTGAR